MIGFSARGPLPQVVQGDRAFCPIAPLVRGSMTAQKARAERRPGGFWCRRLGVAAASADPGLVV